MLLEMNLSNNIRREIKNASYSLSSSSELLAATELFVKENQNDNNSGTCFISVYDKKHFWKNKNDGISISTLQQFEIYGHALAIDSTKTYELPIIFDLDCLSCKNGAKPNSSSFHNKNMLVLENLIFAFVQQLSNFLNIVCNYAWYTNSSCGAHIYIDCEISISHILYTHIVTHFNGIIFNTTQYRLDLPKYLPLPYCAKVDRDTYRLAGGKLENNIGIYSTFLDFPLHIKSNIGETVFLSFYINTINDIWTKKDNNNLKSLCFNKDAKLIKCSDIPKSINYLVEENIKIQTSSSAAFSDFINNIKTLEVKIIKKTQVNDTPILESLNQIGENICKILNYNDLGEENFNYFFYLLNLPEKSFGYAFHLICAFVCYHVNDFKLVISELKTISEKIWPNSNILSIIYDSLLKFNVEAEIKKIYTTSVEDVFKFVAKTLKTPTMFIEEDATEELILEFLESKYIIEKTINSDNYLYWNNNTNVYETFKNTKEVATFTANINFDLSHIKNNKLVIKAINTFLSSRKSISTIPHEYSFFVGTSLGIFCSLFGLYISPIPKLYFTKHKEYARFAISEKYSPSSLIVANSKIISTSKSWEEFLSLIDNKQIENTVKYSILLFGLLGLDYNTSINNNELVCIYKLFLNWQSILKPDFCTICHSYFNFDLNIIEKYYNILYQNKNNSNYILELCNNFDYLYVQYNKIYKNTNEPHKIKFKTTDNNQISFNFPIEKQLDADFNILSLTYVILILSSVFTESTKIEQEIKSCEFTQQQIEEKNQYNEYYNHNLYSYKNLSCIKYGLMKYLNLTLQAQIDLVLYIFLIFKFNTATFLEFAKTAAVLYQPKNQNKKFMLLIGPPHGGKSFICNILEGGNKGNIYKRGSALPALQTSGSDANVIPLYESALTILGEASSINGSLIKGVTGGDSSTLRGMYDGIFKIYYPVGLVVGATNDIPKTEASDAIKTRLAPFRLDISFSNTEENDNPLICFIKNKAFIQTINRDEVSQNFSILLYEVYKKYRDESANIYSTITNPESKELIIQILSKNSSIYRFLYFSRLSVSPMLKTSLDDLKLILDEYIEKNTETKITLNKLITTLIQNFHLKKETENGTVYIYGIGQLDELIKNKTNIQNVIKKLNIQNSNTPILIRQLVKKINDYSTQYNLCNNSKKTILDNILLKNKTVGRYIYISID